MLRLVDSNSTLSSPTPTSKRRGWRVNTSATNLIQTSHIRRLVVDFFCLGVPIEWQL